MADGTLETLEQRMTAMEQEIAQLKQQIHSDKPQEMEPAWRQIVGVFKDCPEFEEAVRLGREWREAQHEDYDDEPTEAGHGSA